VVTEGDTLVGLRLADGSVLERDAIVVASKPHARADFLAPLGIVPKPFEMNDVEIGSVIDVEPTGATSVPGIFAAGNATDISMTLMASAAHGNRVGAWINAELAGEDAARAVAEHRAQDFERLRPGSRRVRRAAARLAPAAAVRSGPRRRRRRTR